MLCLMVRCLRYLLLVMCTHPFAKKGLTLHLAYSEGREPYLGCNLMHRKVLAPFHQHLMAEAPMVLTQECCQLLAQRSAAPQGGSVFATKSLTCFIRLILVRAASG